MRLPNGYGTVYRLPGKRRKPWIARKLVGKTMNDETRKVDRQYMTIGFFAKREEALNALAEYNSRPEMPRKHTRTLAETYEAWSAEYFPTLKESAHYETAWRIIGMLHEEPIADIRLDQIQAVLKASGKNAPMLAHVKAMMKLMYKYAVVHEYIPTTKADMVNYIDIGKANPRKITRRIFDRDELADLVARNDQTSNCILIMIFTGLRTSEFYALTDEDIDLGKQVLYVRASKTASGVREVPIADKLIPRFSHIERDPRRTFSHKMMQRYNHRPHDTRNTFATMLVEAGVDQRVIDAMMGHSAGRNVALSVYTHISLEAKLAAVNLLDIC